MIRKYLNILIFINLATRQALNLLKIYSIKKILLWKKNVLCCVDLNKFKKNLKLKIKNLKLWGGNFNL